MSGPQPSPAGPSGIPAFDDVLSQHRLGRLDVAAAGYRRILAAAPDTAEALHLLGVALCQEHAMLRGAGVIGRALAVRADHAEARGNRANALARAGAAAEAGCEYRRAIALGPAMPDSHFNLGNLQALGPDTAIAPMRFRRAVALAPEHLDARKNLAVALRNLRLWQPAIAELERLIDRQPDRADAHEVLGNILSVVDRLDGAQRHARVALVLSPARAEAHFTLANVQSLRNQSAASVRGYRRVLANAPDHSIAHSNLIFDLDFSPEAGIAEQQRERRLWNIHHARRFAPVSPMVVERSLERRLRIGYVSANFRHHSAAHAFGPVVLNHDRARFEVFLYSDVLAEDEMTAWFRSTADTYRPTAGASDEQVAEAIRQDRIDILVDLSGHSDGNRLLVFARKPAPIQVTAWGHNSGTGLEAMDYFFADTTVFPVAARPLLAEKVFDLPCFVGYMPPSYAPPTRALPDAASPITFGYLNRLSKLSTSALDLWARLLKEMPEARLLLKDKDLSKAEERQRVLAALGDRGIVSERVVLRGRTPHVEHLATYSEVHLTLDPFPYNGGISTFESLWMGVPVIARLGDAPGSRSAAAILVGLGLDEWIVETDEAYLGLAKRLSTDRQALRRHRDTLRPRLAQSPIGDPVRYCRAVETAYREIWRRYVQGPA